MIQVQANPLERLGISQEMVRRFCAENGVGLKDLSKLVQTVSCHASTPFHTDRNTTPGAQQIFTDIQQAVSEVDDEEKLTLAATSYLEKPISQIDHIKAQFEARLALVSKDAKKLANIFGKVFASYSFGSDLFLPPQMQIQNIFVYNPDYSALFLTKRKGSYINFTEVYGPLDKETICEYSSDVNGNLIKRDLRTVNLEDFTKFKTRSQGYKDLRESAPIVGRIDEIIESSTRTEAKKKKCYLRDSSFKDVPGIKIIGMVHIGDINYYLSEAFRLETASVPASDFGRNSVCLLKGSKDDQERFIGEIITNLSNGLTFEQFLPLIKKLKQEHCNGILIGLRMIGEEPRIILLGQTVRLGENSLGVLC